MLIKTIYQFQIKILILYLIKLALKEILILIILAYRLRLKLIDLRWLPIFNLIKRAVLINLILFKYL